MYLAKLHSDSLTKDFRLSGFFNKRKKFETTSRLECLHYAQPVVHFKIEYASPYSATTCTVGFPKKLIVYSGVLWHASDEKQNIPAKGNPR